jgi:hypothetical protein
VQTIIKGHYQRLLQHDKLGKVIVADYKLLTIVWTCMT